MPELLSTFTSTGEKLFYHQEAMQALRDGRGMPIVSHLMPTDLCNFKCAFCSVQHRAGDSLKMDQIVDYISQLLPIGLKAVIISGGGNPLLFRDGTYDFNSLIEYLHGAGLQIGLITNGLPLVHYPPDARGYPMKDSGARYTSTGAYGKPVMVCANCHRSDGHDDECHKLYGSGRMSWKGILPSTLDMLTWVRISLSGWDHKQDRIDTPDLNPYKTTLGGSYVLHDVYDEPADPKHGRVSTPEDVITHNGRVVYGVDRIPELTEKMRKWSEEYKPKYVRLLPNCLEPSLIPERARLLQAMADDLDPNTFFVQVKPPRQPKRCLKGYPHPVANCDGFVYPCDSVVLNRTAGHQFGSAWRMCRMADIGKFYSRPISPNVPNNICPGCVFSDQVDLISNIADGMATPLPDGPEPDHVAFV